MDISWNKTVGEVLKVVLTLTYRSTTTRGGKGFFKKYAPCKILVNVFTSLTISIFFHDAKYWNLDFLHKAKKVSGFQQRY